MLSATHPEGPIFNTRSRTTQQHSSKGPTPHTYVTAPLIPETGHTTMKSLSTDKLDATTSNSKGRLLLQTYFKVSVEWKTPKHKADIFIHVKELLYKHIMDSHQKFLALVIPEAWKYTVLVEAHYKLGHQGSMWTNCLIKWQYYCKGMNKDIRKYIA